MTQCIELQHKLVSSYDNNLTTILVFLDISKAFDKVWHAGLLYKLKKCGIYGSLLTWFTDYVENRVQRIALNGIF